MTKITQPIIQLFGSKIIFVDTDKLHKNNSLYLMIYWEKRRREKEKKQEKDRKKKKSCIRFFKIFISIHTHV